jgi:hypothetical protein
MVPLLMLTRLDRDLDRDFVTDLREPDLLHEGHVNIGERDGRQESPASRFMKTSMRLVGCPTSYSGDQ